MKKGIRGGISHTSKRYAEATNKYMADYDPDEPSTYIQYFDANSLYGWAMSQSLPTHGFKWMRDLTKETVMDILEKANHSMINPRNKKGYIFEVDLEYPPDLWKSHNDYPLAPEKMIVNSVEKLICHFKPRKNYVEHYGNLRQYLEMGMRLTAVHRGISLNQSSWMEPYIRKINTELRKTASNSFEKDFFKLMNNSVFGKTIENIRKRQNIILVDDRATKVIVCLFLGGSIADVIGYHTSLLHNRFCVFVTQRTAVKKTIITHANINLLLNVSCAC